jgi:hypothetical protein
VRSALIALTVASSELVGCSRTRPEFERRVEFQEGPAAGVLRSGWSGFEKTDDGSTFAWAEGPECAIQLPGADPAPHTIRMRAWAFTYAGASPQRLTLFVNDNRLTELDVPSAPTELSLATPWSVWRRDGNVLRLRFARADSPRDRIPGSSDGRKLAVAFDWISIGAGPEAGD